MPLLGRGAELSDAVVRLNKCYMLGMARISAISRAIRRESRAYSSTSSRTSLMWDEEAVLVFATATLPWTSALLIPKGIVANTKARMYKPG